MKRLVIKILSILSVILMPVACDKDDNPGTPGTADTVSYKIAVFCPDKSAERMKKIAEWATENITKAQSGCRRRISLDLEWYDENARDIADVAYRISKDPAYSLIIGPEKSGAAYRVARQVEGRIPMILPVVTSTELQRIYGGKNGLWFLTQSDITQSEILLAQAKLSQYNTVTLLASDDEYGRSFNDWFSYQAIELGLQVEEIILYSSESELRNAVERLHGHRHWYSECIIFTPSSESDLLALDDQLGVMRSRLKPYEIFKFPKIYCSDVAASEQLRGKLSNFRYEGVRPSADPRSGWIAAYQGRFHEEPANGDAHFFDALLIAAYSLYMQRDGEPLNSTIMRLVDNDSGRVCEGWTAPDMQETFRLLESGGEADIRGVTSEWVWDEKNHNNVTGTYFAHWVYDEDTFRTLEYLTLNGADGSISSTQAWEWETSMRQEFEDRDSHLEYPALDDRYAVVVGASDTWANYRHQADALAMYRLLRQHGYDDDHIILITEDNIASDSRNIYPGVVRVTPDGENLYENVKVDYHLSEIDLSDLNDILRGKDSARLPHVISPTSRDNVIIFWCGHGSQNTLMWGSSKYVHGSDMKSLVGGLSEERRFRKLLFVLDACYSGTIGEACEGIPGVLVFTAAHANETSKADVFDNSLNVWLSNGFTRTFRDEVTANPSITLRDLYYRTVRGTTGSHPHIYNAPLYGNMYKETMREFM